MNNEILMGVVNCAAYHLEKLEPRGDIQAVRIAEGIDGNAVNVFHDKVGAAIGEGATVQ